MYNVNIESFIEEVWDYVSEDIVSDDYWEDNYDIIMEITFKFFQFYKKTLLKRNDGTIIECVTTKDCGKMIEEFFKVINSNEIKIPPKKTYF